MSQDLNNGYFSVKQVVGILLVAALTIGASTYWANTDVSRDLHAHEMADTVIQTKLATRIENIEKQAQYDRIAYLDALNEVKGQITNNSTQMMSLHDMLLRHDEREKQEQRDLKARHETK